MINHFFSSLYNRTESAANGVYCPLTAPLVIPDVIATSWSGVRGDTVASVTDFATQAVKIVDASTYREALVEHDPRITYLVEDLGVSAINSLDYIERLLGISVAAVNYAISADQALEVTYRTSKITQEMAAAVLVGLVKRISEANSG